MADTATPQGTVQSALPPAARARLAALEAAEATPPATPAATPTPQAQQPATPATPDPAATPTPQPQGDQVTVSRAEYNELQASQVRERRAQAQADTERLRAEELAHRLTELEKTSKATPDPAVPAPALSVEDVTFTPDEEKDFGDSREFITKVVKQTLAPVMRQLNTLLDGIKQETAKAAQTATTAVSTATRTQERSFFTQVKGSVPELEQIKLHKHWPDFLDEKEPLTGATYEQLLAHNVRTENLTAVTNIYNKFKEKYMAGGANTTAAATAAFAGGTPTAATEPATPAPTKLKQSDRKKASDDYKKGRITWDQLQTISKAFDEAEKNGNIDYNS